MIYPGGEWAQANFRYKRTAQGEAAGGRVNLMRD